MEVGCMIANITIKALSISSASSSSSSSASSWYSSSSWVSDGDGGCLI